MEEMHVEKCKIPSDFVLCISRKESRKMMEKMHVEKCNTANLNGVFHFFPGDFLLNAFLGPALLQTTFSC